MVNGDLSYLPDYPVEKEPTNFYNWCECGATDWENDLCTNCGKAFENLRTKPIVRKEEDLGNDT